MKTKHVLISVILSILLLFTTSQTINAQTESNFSLDFVVTYEFNDQGQAHVIKRIGVTNLSTNFYPANYILEVPEDASGISTFNKQGEIEKEIVRNAGQKQIKIPITEELFGQKSETQITVSYDTRGHAKYEDGIWQVTIPPISSFEEVANYKTTVALPDTWNEPTFIDPPSNTPLEWNKQELGESAIVIVINQSGKDRQFVEVTGDQEIEPEPMKQEAVFAGIAVGVGMVFVLYGLVKYFFHERR